MGADIPFLVCSHIIIINQTTYSQRLLFCENFKVQPRIMLIA